MNIKKIITIDDFWSWSIKKLCTGLRANTWYNKNQPYGLAGFLNDFSSRMIGYASLRQLRVKNSKLLISILEKLLFREIIVNLKLRLMSTLWKV